MKSFITGGKGFVGKHLKELLLKEGHEVVTFDLVDDQDISSTLLYDSLSKERPDYIYHLAAVTSVPESFVDPQNCMRSNVEGSVNLLECVRKLDITCKIHIASSTEVYAPAMNDQPLTESASVRPKTPYGISKLTMEQIAAMYVGLYGMDIVITRTTNHTGPGQDGPFALTSFAKQIVEIERGTKEVLTHGDLTSFKSYLDVRDVVKAYRIAIDLKPYVYNLAAEKAYDMQGLLNRLVAQAKVPVKTSLDTSLVRLTPPDKTTFSTSNLLKEAGWKPEYNLERTLHDVLEYWREK